MPYTPWYSTGTLAVTNGSKTVTGTGTQFLLGGHYGDNLVIGGLDNEIESVNSDTSITLRRNYVGSTASGVTNWAIMPTQSRSKDMLDEVAALVSKTTALADHITVVDDVVTLDGDITGKAATATKWATGRTIALTGDLTGTSSAFDGSANLSLATVLTSTGVSAGTYTGVTVDAKGRVTAGTTTAYLPLSGGTVTGTVAANNFSVQSGASVSGAGIWGIPSVLAFNANSAEGMRLTSTGLGIGTTSPSARLHVDGPFIRYGNSASYTSDEFIIQRVAAGVSLNARQNTNLLLMTNDAEKVRITGTGDVGIGTSTISDRLVVQGCIRATASSGGFGNGQEGAFMDFVPGSAVRIGYIQGSSGTAKPIAIMSAGHQLASWATNGDLTTNGAYFNRNYGAGVSSSGIRLGLNSGAGGGYLSGYNVDTVFGHNTEYISGTGWVARDTTASFLQQWSGNFSWYSATSLTAGSSYTPQHRMILTNGGRLGIGTTSPISKFEVSNGGQEGFQVFPDWAAGACLMQARNAATATNINLYQNALSHIWLADGNERMRLSTGGNLTMTPPATGPVTTPAYMSFGSDYTTTALAENCKIFLYKTSGADDYGFGIGASADLQYHAQGAGGTQGSHRFYVANSEKMRVTAAGQLCVGTNNPRGLLSVEASSGSCRAVNVLTGSSTIDAFTFNGTGIGSITTNGVSTTYNTSSDARLKKNIENADVDAGSLIDAIQIRKFDWKSTNQHERLGVIAQELIEVAPEAVSGSPDGEQMMGVDYSKLVPILIREIQSLRARVAGLEV